jgi:hypothetical protein
MLENVRPELVSPRTVSAPTGDAIPRYRPWVEVSAQVRISVEEWKLDEELWVHWAVPWLESGPDLDAALPFDPGRRAASAGEPPAELRSESVALGEDAAADLCRRLRAGWVPRAHYHPVLHLASGLDESPEAFRRRCVGLFAGAARRVQSPGREGRDAGRLGGAFETRALSGDELAVVRWRVGVGWYPAGVAPAPAPRDPLMQEGFGGGT